MLLHVASLPDSTCGRDARHFIDFLAGAGMSIWQVLPVNPVDKTGSPYQSVSLHAGAPNLISLDDLAEDGLLDANHPRDKPWLSDAIGRFVTKASADQREDFVRFKKQNHYWLEDYALFEALRARFDDQNWWQWPDDIRRRSPDALAAARHQLHDTVEIKRFEQFLFYRQWRRLTSYANDRGVVLFGDMPIYPAHNSVDVWANQALFLLDGDGQPVYVGGVPPDAFSDEGQRWGNPVYDWERMEARGFVWWLDRIKTGLALFDCLRIDHFRGLSACWHIVATTAGARIGEWHPVPGNALLAAIAREHPAMPFVAEDLGVITDEVNALRISFGLPGTRVLQFAFDSDGANPHLPHNHPAHCVSFTGTHDNNTTLGWFKRLSRDRQERVLDYQSHSIESMPWPMIRMNLASVADIAITPMQDVLSLDEPARMNTPGTSVGNWQWRFDWRDVDDTLSEKLLHLVKLYGRHPTLRGF